MRKLALALLFWFGLVGIGCGSDAESTAAPAPDSGLRTDAATSTSQASAAPAPTTPSVLDPRFAAIALLLEIQRATHVECRCLVKLGNYPNLQTCYDRVQFKQGWEECINHLPLPENSEMQSEQLRCALEQLQERNACVETAVCDSDAISTCLASSPECPIFDVEFLSRVVVLCPDSVAVSG